MIVFGWSSFNLASFKPSSIGLPAEMDGDIIIKRVQKYFYLFWIPFFPLEQEWIVRKYDDANSYAPTPAINKHLNGLQLKYKTPWYTFAFPLLAIIIGIVLLIASQISSYVGKKNREEYIIANNKKVKILVANGTPNTYFILRDKDYKTIYVKVIGSDASSLHCIFSQTERSKNYSNRILEAFILDSSENQIKLDTLTILKKDLLDSYNSKQINTFEPKKIAQNYSEVTLVEFEIIDYPVFEFGLSSYLDGNYVSILKNIGAPITNMMFKSDGKYYNTLTLNSPSMPVSLKTGNAQVLSGTYKGVEPILIGTAVFTKENNSIDSCKLTIHGINALLNNSRK